MKAQRFFVVLVVAAQLGLIVGLILRQEYHLRTWHPIRLRVEPVDPISLFRGRYVDLRYHFSQLQTTDANWKKGETIYLQLAPRADSLWQVAGFGRSRKTQTGKHLLRGKVLDVHPVLVSPLERYPRYTLEVRTGLESYFLSERKAPEIERLPRDQYEMTVEVAVADDGRAALNQLYVRGIPAEEFAPK